MLTTHTGCQLAEEVSIVCKKPMSGKTGPVLAIFIFLFFSLSTPSFSTDYTWIGGNGNWSDPNNWSPNTGTPTNGDNVLIDAGTVLLDNSVNVSDLSLQGGAIDLAGNTLTIDGLFGWTVGSLLGNGSVEATFELLLEGASDKVLDGVNLLVTGSLYLLEGDIMLQNSASISMDGGGIFYCDHSGDATIGGDGTGTLSLSEASIFEKTSAGLTTISCQFQSSGGNPSSFNIQAGILEFGAFSTSNVAELDISIGNGAILRYSTGTHIFTTGNSFGGTGHLQLQNADFMVQSNTNFGCNIDFEGGNIGGGGQVAVGGLFDWTGGNFQISNTWTFPNRMDIHGEQAKSIQSGLISITGNCYWTGGDLGIETGGRFVLQNGAVLYDQHSSDKIMGSGTDGFVDLRGQYLKTSGSVTFIRANMTVFPTSSLRINGGSIGLHPESQMTMNGNLIVPPGSLFQVQGGGGHSFAGTISKGSGAGAGTFQVSDGSVSISGSLSTDLVISGGTTTVQSNIQPKNLSLQQGTFNGTGSPEVTGNFVWESGTIDGSGTIKVLGTTTFDTGTRMLYGKSLDMKGNGFWYGGSFEFGNGASLTISANTSFTINHGSSTITGIGQVINNGTLINQSYCNTIGAGIDFTNMGMVKGTGGLNLSTLMNYQMITPGFSTGKLTLDGFDNFTGTCEMEIGGYTAGNEYDQISVTGMGNLSGTLKVILLNGFVPAPGSKLTLIDCPSCTGTFTTLDTSSAALPTGMYWKQSYVGGYILEVASLSLPVELVDFQVFMRDGQPVLVWETATESNNEGFQVQRSQDAQTWQDLGFVLGAGSTVSPKSYAFEDETALRGMNYYRLVQRDWDGTTSFSAIRSIAINQAGKTNCLVYPNPAQQHSPILLELNEGWRWVSISDAFGRLVKSYQHTATSNTVLQMEGLEKGVYFLLVTFAEGQAVTKLEVH